MSIMKPPFHTELNLGHRLSRGLKGVWLFNEAPPPLGSAMDLSGNGNHGTLVGDTNSVPGKFGNALDFDGAGDYINLGTGVSFASDAQGTIAAWFYMDVATDSFVFSNDTSDEAVFFMIFGVDGNSKLKIDHRATATNIVVGLSVLTTGQWYHIVVTSNGSEWALYVNGSAEVLNIDVGSNNGNWFGDTNANVDTFTIGAVRRSSPFYINGQIDNVTIWDRALSAGEIKELFRDPFQMFKRNL